MLCEPERGWIRLVWRAGSAEKGWGTLSQGHSCRSEEEADNATNKDLSGGDDLFVVFKRKDPF